MIIQDDRFDATASVTVCRLTTNPVEGNQALQLTVEVEDLCGELTAPDQLAGKTRGNAVEVVELGRDPVEVLGAPQVSRW